MSINFLIDKNKLDKWGGMNGATAIILIGWHPSLYIGEVPCSTLDSVK